HEQKVPLELEWDEADVQCIHVLAEDEAGKAIGTGRPPADGHIRRIAVLADWRGRGGGAAVLSELLPIGRAWGFTGRVLDGQTRAVGFYLRYGFHCEGEEFLDAGIPHRSMRLRWD